MNKFLTFSYLFLYTNSRNSETDNLEVVYESRDTMKYVRSLQPQLLSQFVSVVIQWFNKNRKSDGKYFQHLPLQNIEEETIGLGVRFGLNLKKIPLGRLHKHQYKIRELFDSFIEDIEAYTE